QLVLPSPALEIGLDLGLARLTDIDDRLAVENRRGKRRITRHRRLPASRPRPGASPGPSPRPFRSATVMPRSRAESNVSIIWRGSAGSLGSVILLLLGGDRIARGASPESTSAQQVMKIDKSRKGRLRHTKLHAGAHDRVEHPGRQH